LWSRGWRSDRGASAVELALALPLLAVVLLGTIDFGRLFYHAMAVTHAARAGAQYGSQSVGRAADHPGMQNAATTAAGDLGGGFSATATHFCTCYVPTTETSIGCTATCAGERRVYTQVTGTATFSTLVNYPGIPASVPITRIVQMRAQ
jgi:Flp pilus assembly protein TadG